MGKINCRKLHGELEKAGIEINGCNSDGVVWDKSNKEIQDRPDVQAIIKAHDPTPTPVETQEEMIRRISKEEIENDKLK